MSGVVVKMRWFPHTFAIEYRMLTAPAHHVLFFLAPARVVLSTHSSLPEHAQFPSTRIRDRSNVCTPAIALITGRAHRGRCCIQFQWRLWHVLPRARMPGSNATSLCCSNGSTTLQILLRLDCVLVERPLDLFVELLVAAVDIRDVFVLVERAVSAVGLPLGYATAR